MSPASTSCESTTSPARFTTRTVPSTGISNVLSCEPYSSAFCAMSPTLGTEPIVAGSNAPWAWQSRTTASYTPAYDESGMTASVSCSSPAAFHICPESRIIGGIDASMMMSLGTCRLVMPRSESTIASAGPSCRRAVIAPSIAARSASGSAATRASTSASPSLGFTPMRSNVSPYFANTSAK